jgi:hypothetical protein
MTRHLSLIEIVAAGATLLASSCSGPVDPDVPESGAEEGAPSNGASLVCDSSPVADPPYSTVDELDALVVARWARCAGPPQLEDETLGVALTPGRLMMPLERGPDGAVVTVPPVPGVGPESWAAFEDAWGHPRIVFMWASSVSKSMSSFVIDGPFFFDGGEQMFLPYSRVGATYVRLGP